MPAARIESAPPSHASARWHSEASSRQAGSPAASAPPATLHPCPLGQAVLSDDTDLCSGREPGSIGPRRGKPACLPEKSSHRSRLRVATRLPHEAQRYRAWLPAQIPRARPQAAAEQLHTDARPASKAQRSSKSLALISRLSQTLARLQSRITVFGCTPSASA